MLIAMILLIVIGIVILILFSLCRVATLSDEYAELMRDPEYLVDEEDEAIGETGDGE